MTPEQEAFVDMLENYNLVPNLTMTADGGWEMIEIELRKGATVVTLTFNPDGKLIDVVLELPLTP